MPKWVMGLIGVFGVSGIAGGGAFMYEQNEQATRQDQLEQIIIEQQRQRQKIVSRCEQLQMLCRSGKLPPDSHECAIAFSPSCPELLR